MKLLAGKIVLHGNVDPMTLYQGSKGDVETETETLLRALGSYGGVILGDGYNIVPGSPLSNLEAIRATSSRVGVRFSRN
jgi:uroporphyrinogen-III decarboxylase